MTEISHHSCLTGFSAYLTKIKFYRSQAEPGNEDPEALPRCGAASLRKFAQILDYFQKLYGVRSQLLQILTDL